MSDTTTSEHRLAEFVARNSYTIVNAMQVYASRMREGAQQAREAYEAGQANPAVKAAQDASLMMNSGYRMAAELAEESAATAIRVSEELRELTEDYEDGDGF